MARRVIVLDQLVEPNGELHYQYVLWPTVPASRQSWYANASFQSVVRDGSVTAGELTALQTGSVTEIQEEARWPSGTTLAQAQAALQARFTSVQNAITSANPWQRYGSYWDDVAGWTMRANG